MKCPVCDHKTNYRNVSRFIAHMHKEHQVKESVALQIWCGVIEWSDALEICPNCGQAVPKTLYCLYCTHPLEASKRG